MKKLTGKVAIVTGASRKKGIGFAIAQVLVQNGADVFLTYFLPYDIKIHQENNTREVKEILTELRKYGQRVETLEIDLSAGEAPKAFINEVIKTLGKVDILINNACYSGRETIETLTAESLDQHYAVNVRATMLLTSEFAKHFRGKEGFVVSMTSGQGVGPMPEEVSYAATKGAIDAFTLSARPTLAKKNIKIYALDPGPVDTGWMSEGLKTEVAKASSLGRVTEPIDVARTIFELLMDDAIPSGQVIHKRYGI